MDGTAQKMDKPSPLDNPIKTRKTWTGTLSQRPFSFWLRLAHYSKYAPCRNETQAVVRSILDYEIVLQIEGHSWIWCDEANGSVDIEPGDVVFIPPHYRHGYSNSRSTHLAVHFDFHANPKLAAFKNLQTSKQLVRRTPLNFVPALSLSFSAKTGDNFSVPLITKAKPIQLWQQRLDPLVRLWQRRTHDTFSGRLQVNAILGWALASLMENPESGLGYEKMHPKITEILQELAKPGAAQTSHSSIPYLAGKAGMSETSFRAAFVEATGRTPRDYIEQLKIERAAHNLLETNLRIGEIARDEGYSDIYHFSRVFKRVMKSSPRKYRLQAHC
jgi:AraC-like DNA-binding protein